MKKKSKNKKSKRKSVTVKNTRDTDGRDRRQV